MKAEVMLGHGRRRWSNITPAISRRMLIAGYALNTPVMDWGGGGGDGGRKDPRGQDSS